MSTKTTTRNNDTENGMIAADLRAAGFKAEVQAEYGVVKVSLNRRAIYAYEIEVALFDAGYDASQYSLNAAAGVVLARAITL